MNEEELLKQMKFRLDGLFSHLSNVDVMVNELKKEMFSFQMYIGLQFRKLKEVEGE